MKKRSRDICQLLCKSVKIRGLRANKGEFRSLYSSIMERGSWNGVELCWTNAMIFYRWLFTFVCAEMFILRGCVLGCNLMVVELLIVEQVEFCSYAVMQHVSSGSRLFSRDGTGIIIDRKYRESLR